MPEGPSIRILKETAMIFKGKKIKEVSGNSKLPIQRLKGKKIIDLRTWGKHFLICFDDFTVRIHLMMFGSYRINEAKEEATPRLSLQFAKGEELNFYTCSVQFIEEDLNNVYDWEADIMSDKWNAKKAVDALKKSKKLEACDALLDQHIFSGSGNIIKCEVLFRTRIHPETIVSELPAKKLKELVNETSNYSFDFYEWKKVFELSKHWEAYKQKVCPRCNIPLSLEYLGKTKRRTFFCNNCQILYKGMSK